MYKLLKKWKNAKIRTQIILTYIAVLLLSFIMTFTLISAVNGRYTKIEVGKAGVQTVNYTDKETPWTRIIEHKWFEFGKDENGNDLPKTIISREYSSEWKPGDEPYYPVNDENNSALYNKYREKAKLEKKVIFGGRLGEYKYYDMDGVIDAALDMCERELGCNI